MGSNSTQGMVACVFSVFVLSFVYVLALLWLIPCPPVYGIKKLKKQLVPNKGLQSNNNNNNNNLSTL
jgi:hypothetical protein